MATVALSADQTRLLDSLGVLTPLTTDIPDGQWCDITDLLLEEIQLRGLDARYDKNEYGKLCESIYYAMMAAEEGEA